VTAGEKLQVRHRIGGLLHPAAEEPAGVMEVLLGRLEIFTLLVVLTPAFWRK
jgi:hypothetical protein